MEVFAAVELIPLLNQIWNIALAALGLGLVIFLHELGHFAVAKWCDVYVERFSIGFGPVLFSRKWGETEYALSLIPFGGYVKMLGQDDADPSQLTSEEIAADPRSYIAKPVIARMAIISAGVTMNVISAFLFYIIVFLAGYPMFPSKIGSVRPGMPAWEAGIREGDTIEAINDGNISTFRELLVRVSLSSGPLKIQGRHDDGQSYTVTVVPNNSNSHPQIGVSPMESLKVFDTVWGRPATSKEPATQTPAVAKTPDGKPALRKGDLLKKVGDNEVKSATDFHREVAANTANPLLITVQRTVDPDGKPLVDSDGKPATDGPTEVVALMDNFFRTLGITLDSGPIAAVRRESPAERAGLKKGDKLAKMAGLNIGTEIDPLKLPVEFAKRAGQEIEVSVTRQQVGGAQESVTVKLTPDDTPGWVELPQYPGEPLSIPSIGVAFHILPVVLAVTPEGPADKAGIKPGLLKKMTLTKKPDAVDRLGEAKESVLTYSFEKADVQNCAYAFWKMQTFPQRKVTLTIEKEGKLVDHEVQPELDRDWHLPIVGAFLEPERFTQKAENLQQACVMSLNQTKNTAMEIYMMLRSLATMRVSFKELHGPIGIAQSAYEFAQQGWISMLLFLGMLSINLAVLNFLPIPVLDGGHMVFLLWEALTRKKPNEKLQIGATYIGLAFLLGLMVLVLYLDLFVHPFAKK